MSSTHRLEGQTQMTPGPASPGLRTLMVRPPSPTPPMIQQKWYPQTAVVAWTQTPLVTLEAAYSKLLASISILDFLCPLFCEFFLHFLSLFLHFSLTSTLPHHHSHSLFPFFLHLYSFPFLHVFLLVLLSMAVNRSRDHFLSRLRICWLVFFCIIS